jgi:alpha-galactosidase
MDPLTSAVCTTPEISQMVDEMLVAQARWLPQYKRAIPAARARFASEAKLGVHGTRGAARLKMKTVADMRQDADEARRNAGAADKAMDQRKQAVKAASKR